MDSKGVSNTGASASPIGPEGLNSSSNTSSNGSIRNASNPQKNIPAGEGVEQTPLKRRQVDIYSGIPPKIHEPSTLAETGIAGEFTAQAVLNRLKKMEPSITADMVRRVSEDRKAEMVERFEKVQRVLKKKPVRDAVEQKLLVFESDFKKDVTLNSVMALALQVRLAQDSIQGQVNSDNRNVAAWAKGIKEFRELQKAWVELHVIVSDICSHEPLAVKLTNSMPFEQSSRGIDQTEQDDLISFSDVDIAGPSSIPPPLSFQTPLESQLVSLEEELAPQKNYYRQLQEPLKPQMVHKEARAEQLEREGGAPLKKNTQLQQEVNQLKEELKNKPSVIGSQRFQAWEAEVQGLKEESHNIRLINKELEHQLNQEREESHRLREKDDKQKAEISKKESSIEEQGVELGQLRGELDVARKENQLLENMRSQVEKSKIAVDNANKDLLKATDKLKSLEESHANEKYKLERELSDYKTGLSELQQKLDKTEQGKKDEIKNSEEQLSKIKTALRDAVDELEQSKHDDKIAINSLREELEKYKGVVDDLEKTHAAEKEKIIEVFDEEKKSIVDGKDLLEKYLEEERELRKKDKLDSDANVLGLKKDYESVVSELNREVAQLKAEQEVIKAEAVKIKDQEMMDLDKSRTAEMVSLEAELNQEQQNVKKLAEENTDLRGQLSDADKEIVLLESNLESVVKDQQDKLAQLKEAATENEKLKNSLKEFGDAKLASDNEFEEQIDRLKTEVYKEREAKFDANSARHDAEENLNKFESKYKSTVKELEEANLSLSDRNNKISKLQISASELNANLASLKDDKGAVERELLGLEAVKNKLIQDLEGSRKKNTELESVFKVQQDELDQRARGYESQLSDLKELLDDSGDKNTQLLQLQELLTKKDAELLKGVKELESSIQEKNDQARRLEEMQRDIDDKQVLIASGEASRDELNKKLEVQIKEKEELLRELTENNENLDTLKDNMISLDESIAKKSLEFEIMSEEKARLEEELVRLQEEAEESRNKFQLSVEEKLLIINGLEKDFELKNNELEAVNDDRDRIREELQSARSQLSDFADESKALEQKIKDNEALLEEEKGGKAAASLNLEKVNKETSSLKDNLVAVSSEKERLKGVISSLEDDLSALSMDKKDIEESLNAQIDKLKSDLEKERLSLEEVKKEFEKLSRENSDKSLKINEQFEDLKQLNVKEGKLRSELDSANASNEELSLEIKNLNIEKEGISGKIRILARDKEVVDDKLATLKKDLEGKEELIQSLNGKINYLTPDISRVEPNEKVAAFLNEHFSEYSGSDISVGSKDFPSFSSNHSSDFSILSSVSERSDNWKMMSLESSVNELFDRFDKVGINDVRSDLLKNERQKLKIDFRKGRDDLKSKVAQLKKEDKEQGIKNGGNPPSHQELRKGVVKIYSEFRNNLISLKDKYIDGIGSIKQYYNDGVDPVETSLAEAIEAAGVMVEGTETREQYFSEQVAKYANQNLSDDISEEVIQKTHGMINIAMSAPDDQEVANFAVCSRVQTIARKIEAACKKSLLEVNNPEEQRKLLGRYTEYLSRLLPDNLPLNLGKKLDAQSAKYMTDLIHHVSGEIESGYVLKRLNDEEVFDVRGFSGLKVAREMIADPKIRPVILSLLSSLKGSHEGVANRNEYYKASEAGLKFLRDEFGLLQIPIMDELLTVAIADLDKPGSKLVTELEKQSLGSSVDKSNKNRREKLKSLCLNYQKKEVDVKGEALFFRGQSVNENSLVRHPHSYVFDRFRNDDIDGGVFNRSSLGREEPSAAGKVQLLKNSTQGLMNNFFHGVPDGATLLINEAAQHTSLQLKKGNPGDVQFKLSAKGRWQVALANDIWTVDPAILYNPDLTIPFEGHVSEEHHQRWLPLKSFSGETAILLLSPQGRYYLYEKGYGNELVPRTIRNTDPAQEKVEAAFLYNAARYLEKHSVESIKESMDTDSDQFIREIAGASSPWLKTKDITVLRGVYKQAKERIHGIPVGCPIPVSEQQDFLRYQQIEQPPAQQVAMKKRGKKVTDDLSEMVTDISTGHRRGKVGKYNPELYTKASVAPTFEEVGNTFNDHCPKASAFKSQWVKTQEQDRDEFRRGAFKELSTYDGCELHPDKEQSLSSSSLEEGTPGYAQMVLRKAIKVNTNDRMRLKLQMEGDSDQLIESLRKIGPNNLSDYSDREVLNMAILEFERGKLPKQLKSEDDKKEYAQRLSAIILTQSKYEQLTRISEEQTRLMVQLERIKADASLLRENNPTEYKRRCESFNLDQAMLATRQEATAELLDRFHDKTLNTASRTIQSFQKWGHTVLRENQVEEVNESLAQISEAMEFPSGTMSRISHKGTGWGKSTIIQLLSDHACSHNLGRDKRSVLVIAPESNQKELDKVLGRYYSVKGRHYRSLDIEKDYSNYGKQQKWWTPESIDRIHNTLLGLDPKTDITARALAVEELRAPVGVSVKDVQILMQLRKALQTKEDRSPDEIISLQKLDAVVDLIRKSMVFCDEWDSTLTPPKKEELDAMTDKVKRSLSGLSTQVKPMDAVRNFAHLLSLCEIKQLLSATTGSDHAASLMSGEVSPEAIKKAMHTDTFTTQQRLWHLLNTAEFIYINGSDDDSEQEVIRQAINKVGVDRSVLVFDARDKTVNGSQSAVKNHKLLAQARASQGGEPRGTLFYDESKQLHMYLPGHPRYGSDGGAPVPVEEERYLRETYGSGVDISLGQAQSVGTDAPQGLKSVGIYIGGLEQGKEGRLDYILQQIGRLTRGSTDLRKLQDLFIGIDESSIDKLDIDKKLKEAFKKSSEGLASSKEALEGKLGSFIENSSSAQQAVIHSALIFDVPATSEKDLNSLEDGLNKELDRLAKTEWIAAGFNSDQCSALKEYKSNQFHKKFAALRAIAAELANRERSEQLEGYEEQLQAAKIDSELERVYSEEEAWLKSGMAGKLKEFELPELAEENLSSDTTKGFIRQGIITESQRILSSIPRRTIEHPGDLDRLEDQIATEKVEGDLEAKFKKLAEKGFELPSMNELDLPVPDFKNLDGTKMTTRQKLQAESIALHEKALESVKIVISMFKEKTPVGLSLLIDKSNELKERIKLIEGVSDEGVEAALNTPPFLNNYYKEVFKTSHDVGLDASSHGVASNLETLKKVAAHLLEVIDIGSNYKPRKANKGYDPVPQKKLDKKVFTAVKESKREKSLTGATYDVLSWKDGARDKYDLPDCSPREGYVNSNELSKVVEKAGKMKGVMDQHRIAKDFCKSHDAEYKMCIEKMKQDVLKELSKRDESSLATAKDFSARTKEQAKYMQSQIPKK